jgi:hypothetical protein
MNTSEMRCATYILLISFLVRLFGWPFLTSLWHWCSVSFLVCRTWRRWPSLFRWSLQWVQSKTQVS